MTPDTPPRPSLNRDELIFVIASAKKELRHKGKSRAYYDLLRKFHAVVLPPFLAETGGNLAKTSRLLGIERGTLKKYALSAGNCERWVSPDGIEKL